MKFKLRDFFLNEEIINEAGELHYEATFGGEKFQVVVDVNKNETKKGIKVKFFPVNEQGMVLNNLTPEEIDTLQNSIATTVSKKFNEYGLDKVLGGGGEAPAEETEVPNEEENA
jgi:hypothetical protein